MHYENYDKSNVNRKPIGNTSPSLKDVAAIYQPLFLITSSWIRIRKPVFIVLLQTKLINNFVPIAIE